MKKELYLSFDLGHSSIGWSAISTCNGTSTNSLSLEGTGVVTFRPDDNQNHTRAAFRRQRRNIAARRNRIRRLGNYLVNKGLLSNAQVESKATQGGGHRLPYLLAAQIITGVRDTLTDEELWDVLRWYAHNRGYDGNALWTDGGDDSSEDVEKVKKAHALLEEYGGEYKTMATTVCAYLGIDPQTSDDSVEPTGYFKGENAAFPRGIVTSEVRKILNTLNGKLEGLDDDFITALMDDWSIALPHLDKVHHLPKRYSGGLLFGQMIPRFDNRMIPLCSKTGKKTPLKHSKAYYRYRWAMLLKNITVEDSITGAGRPLAKQEREKLHAHMEDLGYLTKGGLAKFITDELGLVPYNLESMFLSADMEKALVLDPVKRELASEHLKTVWPTIPDKQRKIFAGLLFKSPKNKPQTLRVWRDRLVSDGVDISAFDQAMEERLVGALKRHKSKKSPPPSIDTLLDKPIKLSAAAEGRARYCRPLLEKAFEEVMEGIDPTAKEEYNGQERDGCLVESPGDYIHTSLGGADQYINNHLIRHRLLVYERLLADLVKTYADGDTARVVGVTVEVIRDLQEFSSKTAKEKAQLIGLKLANHKRAVNDLEDWEQETGESLNINATLIKKMRIANDLGRRCPFTGKSYSIGQLREMEFEHVIPRSLRPSDSMESLVLTFPQVNKWKGQTSAYAFMRSHAGEKVPGSNLQLLTLKMYEDFVKGLKVFGPSDDDRRRCQRRKDLLLVENYKKHGGAENEESGFTGRDISITSYLNKLAAQTTLKYFKQQGDYTFQPHHITHLAGSVTGYARRAWDLDGNLEVVCPQIMEITGDTKPKGEIRNITHLHHALDAVILGLVSHYFPKNGRLWELMSRRSIGKPEEQEEFRQLVKGGLAVRFSTNGRWEFEEIPDEIKKQIRERLAECRVVRHQPKTMSGLGIEQNVWRILAEDDDESNKMKITQATPSPVSEGGRLRKNRVRKYAKEKKASLLGYDTPEGAGKMQRLKGGIIIKDNYGVALDPELRVIPHCRVWKQIMEITRSNNGVTPRILRNGDIIQIEKGTYSGRWRIASIKDSKIGVCLNLALPDRVYAIKDHGGKENVRLKTLVRDGLTCLKLDYTGHPVD